MASAGETEEDRNEMATDRYMISGRESGKARRQMNKEWEEVKEHSHGSPPGKGCTQPSVSAGFTPSDLNSS